MAVGRTERATTSGDGPVSGWERYGERVRAARERLDLPVEYVAKKALTYANMVRDIEAGTSEPDSTVIRHLDKVLEAEGVLWDAWAQIFLSSRLQAGATVADLLFHTYQVRHYAPLVLPDGYLTEEYARALLQAERPMKSNSFLTDRPAVREVSGLFSGAPYYCLIVDEAALTRPVAPPKVMREQLTHLRKLAMTDSVTVHVIPEGTAPHPGLRGAFWTLSFSPRHNLAYTPLPHGPGHLVTDATQVKSYSDLFATLQGVSLPAASSLRVLDEAIERFPDKPRPRAITTGPADDGIGSALRPSQSTATPA
ncbi:helix-turn-helix domain-containing protein [Nocardiopsis tropica]|uniref:Scr1 family TA system antitoxin-like transcriptional regulator n=1 Tax=Nocardiopsis tropica TaxID=109330 RepID=A0ABU7KWR0_9ACTN|nr:Scr1 family TA system antitoxin-like transcriptional regulator [Nocardiopsis umidischolae]MEE2053743.1 Scr1 family TA system antitoxin-like transcriptional regulator [Nocardiopsis umidischolae]